MIELTLDIDNFNRPKVHEDLQAIAYQFYALLNMRKDSDPADPDRGIDILRYKASVGTPETISELKSEIENQIETYTDFQSIDIEVQSVKDHILVGLVVKGYEDEVVLVSSDGETSQLDILLNRS